MTGLVGIIVAGGFKLAAYSSRPGLVGAVQRELSDAQSVKADCRGTLILSIHPHCPCTMATARTVERLATSFHDSIEVVAYVYCPNDADPSWADSVITQVLQRVPGLEIRLDRDGRASASLGAKTSGHVFFYNARGQLAFSGGITPGRGHEGPCTAAEDLMRRIAGLPGCGHWPVFGCQIIQTKVEG